METLESSCVCRLCGQQSGISIDIFDRSENHVRKINTTLPIMVHEMDLLPKHMCHRCSYKLEEFHKFYMDCLKTDTALKSQLSWMQKGHGREKIGVPMVHIENVNIKTEPLDGYDVYELEPIVENIDYINSINSMTNSVAFPTGCIREGLTYAAFSRCRCCCDKDQSRRRTTAERLCRNYEGSVSRCAEMADDPRRRTALDGASIRLKSTRKKILAHATLQDQPRDQLSPLDTVEEARVRLSSAETKNMSALNARNRSDDNRYAAIAETALQAADVSESTVMRSLRPRNNVVNYTLTRKYPPNRKKRNSVSELTTKDEVVNKLRPRKNSVNYALSRPYPSNRKKRNSVMGSNKMVSFADSNVTPASNLELARQIKIEFLDDLSEERSLRPRKNITYCAPKKNNSKLQSKNKNTPSNLKIRIKQEILDDLPSNHRVPPSNIVLSETTSTTFKLPKVVNSSMKDNLRNNVNYDETNRPRSSSKLAKRKPVVASTSSQYSMKNKLKKPKRIGCFPPANYSPKPSLRSQDGYLRNGKTRKYDYANWSMQRRRTKNEAKNAKKMPAMLLAESIKHYCEACNVSFMNQELFSLHTCYYD